MNAQSLIRNFCIIAHIDHGKSTLADRLLELTGTIETRNMKAQLLDSMDLEREKGITIKLQPVRMAYRQNQESRIKNQEENLNSKFVIPNSNQVEYQLNLIDTPGHVDFSYEVSRSLAAVEGAILVVDATQGIQAQTLATVYMAIEAGLTILPVINKIDLPAADSAKVSTDLVNLLGCAPEDIMAISAKTGQGVETVLSAIIKTIPPPTGAPTGALRALVFDSVYNEYRGVILYVRMIDGSLTKDTPISLMASGETGLALEVGVFKPALTPTPKLSSGETGYIVTNFKSISQAGVGDTITSASQPASQALPGYTQVKPFVFAGFFPTSNQQHQILKEAINKLALNDASLQFSPESSEVLGFGFRIGFLGLLHLEIVKERLEREYGLELVVTNPSTGYEVVLTDGSMQVIRSASELPDVSKITEIREPWIEGEVISPKSTVGSVVQLINNGRGYQTKIDYLDELTTHLTFESPLASVLTNFYDKLKSVTQGYGSFNYELRGYRAQELVRLDLLVGGQKIDAFSQIVHRSEAETQGRKIVSKLKDAIPRQLFEVTLQAAIGGKIIAREDVKQLGKNVTAKLYGGDISRKKKLWAKQKKGKAKMKKIGNVDIPPEAFMVMLKQD